MKTKLLLIFLLLTAYCLLSTAQVPQGFNYQAIARDGVNPITTPIDVRITIQSASDGGTTFWKEVHSSVTPNTSGLFSLIIGTGAMQAGSAAATFSDIDWTVTPKYLKTEIDNGGGFIAMGTSQLWSVPYSTVAGDLKGTLGKLSVVGETANLEEALFEVKNQGGQTIFAVYNEGVRIYVADGSKGSKGGFAIGGFGASKADTPGQQYFIVNRDSIRAYIWDDPLVKAPKGGFAIGGFGSAKTFTNDYMLISPDSARIYINNASSTKGKKGGFAIGGFGAAKRTDPQRLFTVSDDSIRMYIDDNSKASKGGFAIGGFGSAKGPYKSFLNVSTDATGVVNPAQNRILWYPIKNAFLSGQILIHHPDSIGLNSTTTGFESRAKGAYSQAMGYQAIARGQYSTAIGKNALAARDNSFAFGNNAIALNTGTYAFGRKSQAKGIASFAMGDSAISNSENSYSFGKSVKALGTGSFAFGFLGQDSTGYTGIETTASGNYSFALGLGAQTGSGAPGAFAIGSHTNAQGPFSMALGYRSATSNWYSVAIGYKSQALEENAFAIGAFASAEGENSIAVFGKAYGLRSISIGKHSSATGDFSVAIGGYMSSPPNLIVPHYTKAFGDRSFAIGTGVKASGFRSFVIGNGNNGELIANPPPIMNGTAEGDYSFAIGTNVIASGEYATAMGYYTTAQPFSSFVVGRCNIVEGDIDSWVSTDPLFVVGNGTSSSARSNALTVKKNGFTNTGGSFRVSGNTAPATGSGVEILYNTSTEVGYMYCYNRTASAYIPLTVYTGLVRPVADNLYNCGGSSYRWKAVYAVNGAIQTSDRRMKDNIMPFSGGLGTILSLNPVFFTWKDQPSGDKHLGLIAQDVLPIIPEIVDVGDDPDKTLGINYAGLVPVLVNAIQEQQQQIENQKKEIEELKALVNSIVSLQTAQDLK